MVAPLRVRATKRPRRAAVYFSGAVLAAVLSLCCAACGGTASQSLALSVSSGPVGTLVHVSGKAGPGCVVGKNWPGFDFEHYGELTKGPVTAMIAPPAADGTWSTTFAVPSFLGGSAARGPGAPTTPGRYELVAPWCKGHGLAKATFQVTSSAPASAVGQGYVGIAATVDGGGYWLVQADGAVSAFGDASWFGSVTGRLAEPIVGMARTYDGQGYWLVDADGHVYCLGDARRYGSLPSSAQRAPVTGIAAAPNGKGYWLVDSAGHVYGFGDARVEGMPSTYLAPYDAIAARPAGGYLVTAASSAAVYAFPGGQLAGGALPLRSRPYLPGRRSPRAATARGRQRWTGRSSPRVTRPPTARCPPTTRWCRRPSRGSQPAPTARATGSWARTATCTTSATPASWGPGCTEPAAGSGQHSPAAQPSSTAPRSRRLAGRSGELGHFVTGQSGSVGSLWRFSSQSDHASPRPSHKLPTPVHHCQNATSRPAPSTAGNGNDRPLRPAGPSAQHAQGRSVHGADRGRASICKPPSTRPCSGLAAPVPLFVLDRAGTIIYRNPAQLDTVKRVTERRGEAVVAALREAAGDMVRTSPSFPVTKMVSAERGGVHAYAEMTIDRVGDAFGVTWADVTDREDNRRFLTRIAADLKEAAVRLAGVSEKLGGDASSLSERAGSVAAAATEMTASMGEIGRSATAAAANTSAAVAAAQAVSGRVAELDDLSAKIGSVSKLITSIAAQTNLLALNATIEAARAGEAGRGFAVVAGEVKELANQTSQATRSISGMITRIQEASSAVAGAISEIVSLIGGIEAQQTTIAAAVEEQTVVSGEMSRSINGVSASTQSVTNAVEQLRATASDVAAKASEVAART